MVTSAAVQQRRTTTRVKVLLLYPKFLDTFWSLTYALKFIRKKASLPPLGLLTVAAMLPADWEQRLVDLNVRRLRDQDLAWADVVFISGMIAQRDSACQLIAHCRAAGKRIVAGGPLFTAEHEQFPDVDHFVLNEAEVTLPEFLRDLAGGSARRAYSTDQLPPLSATPVPAWGLADLPRYASMSVQFSRGCPFDCEFCNVTAMFGHRPPQIRTSFNWRNLYAFAQANLRLGVLGRERFQYWGLILWTFFRRPAALQMAVTLAIYGHPFRRTCDLMGL